MTKRGILLGSVGGLLLFAAGAGGSIWAMRDGMPAKVDADAVAVARAAENVPDDVARQAEPIYYTFDQPFTANMRASAAMLQAGVSVSSHYAQTIEDLKNDGPALRAAVLQALADLPEDIAENEAAKQTLAGKVAAAINLQLKADGYTPAVDAVYFTDFVVQGNEDND